MENKILKPFQGYCKLDDYIKEKGFSHKNILSEMLNYPFVSYAVQDKNIVRLYKCNLETHKITEK